MPIDYDSATIRWRQYFRFAELKAVRMPKPFSMDTARHFHSMDAIANSFFYEFDAPETLTLYYRVIDSNAWLTLDFINTKT